MTRYLMPGIIFRRDFFGRFMWATYLVQSFLHELVVFPDFPKEWKSRIDPVEERIKEMKELG